MNEGQDQIMHAPKSRRAIKTFVSPPLRGSTIAAQLEAARSPASEHHQFILENKIHSLSEDLDKVLQKMTSKRIPHQHSELPYDPRKYNKRSHSNYCVQHCKHGINETMWIEYPASKTKRAFIFVAFEYNAAAGILHYGATICNKQEYPGDLALHARTARYRFEFLPIVLRGIWCTCNAKLQLSANIKSTIRNMMRAYGCHDTPDNNQSTFPPSANKMQTIHTFNPKELDSKFRNRLCGLTS